MTIFPHIEDFIPVIHLFCTKSLFLKPFRFLSSVHHSSLWQPLIYSLYHPWLYFCFFITTYLFGFFRATYMQAIEYLFTSVWLTLPNTICPIFTHLVANGKFSFPLCLSNILLCVWTHTSSSSSSFITIFIHLSSSFYIMTLVNSGATNIGLHIYFQINVFIFLSDNIQEWNCWIIQQFYF